MPKLRKNCDSPKNRKRCSRSSLGSDSIDVIVANVVFSVFGVVNFVSKLRAKSPYGGRSITLGHK